MAPRVDLTGQRFGKWLVVAHSDESTYGNHKWNCICECGVKRAVAQLTLKNGGSKGCGIGVCAVAYKHGHGSREQTPTYRSWDNMIQRCTNTKHTSWKDYGGRGISVCARWRNSFEDFLADMGERPDGMTLDRWPNNNNGNYEPNNCRWATVDEQNNNRRLRGN